MTRTLGTICYARSDDEATNGLITRIHGELEPKLRSALGVKDGEIYIDRGISPGVNWKSDIDSAIKNSKFFIIFISPTSALSSRECERELKLFLSVEKEKGRDDLIFPIDFVPLLHERISDESVDGTILSVCAQRQRIDWLHFNRADGSAFKDMESFQLALSKACMELADAIAPRIVDLVDVAPSGRSSSGARGASPMAGDRSTDSPNPALQKPLAARSMARDDHEDGKPRGVLRGPEQRPFPIPPTRMALLFLALGLMVLWTHGLMASEPDNDSISVLLASVLFSAHVVTPLAMLAFNGRTGRPGRWSPVGLLFFVLAAVVLALVGLSGHAVSTSEAPLLVVAAVADIAAVLALVSPRRSRDTLLCILSSSLVSGGALLAVLAVLHGGVRVMPVELGLFVVASAVFIRNLALQHRFGEP